MVTILTINLIPTEIRKQRECLNYSPSSSVDSFRPLPSAPPSAPQSAPPSKPSSTPSSRDRNQSCSQTEERLLSHQQRCCDLQEKFDDYTIPTQDGQGFQQGSCSWQRRRETRDDDDAREIIDVREATSGAGRPVMTSRGTGGGSRSTQLHRYDDGRQGDSSMPPVDC